MINNKWYKVSAVAIPESPDIPGPLGRAIQSIKITGPFVGNEPRRGDEPQWGTWWYTAATEQEKKDAIYNMVMAIVEEFKNG